VEKYPQINNIKKILFGTTDDIYKKDTKKNTVVAKNDLQKNDKLFSFKDYGEFLVDINHIMSKDRYSSFTFDEAYNYVKNKPYLNMTNSKEMVFDLMKRLVNSNVLTKTNDTYMRNNNEKEWRIIE
jgi:hypothetical protein